MCGVSLCMRVCTLACYKSKVKIGWIFMHSVPTTLQICGKWLLQKDSLCFMANGYYVHTWKETACSDEELANS